jgi:hypothetical protein
MLLFYYRPESSGDFVDLGNVSHNPQSSQDVPFLPYAFWNSLAFFVAIQVQGNVPPATELCAILT